MTGQIAGLTHQQHRLRLTTSRSRSVSARAVLAIGLWALTIAYAWSVTAVERPESGYDTIWEGWVSNAIFFGAPLMILWRLASAEPRQPGHVALMLGLTSNAIAGVVYSYYDQNLDPIPFPALSDVFYLLGYAGIITAVVQLVHRTYASSATVRVDGLIMALGVASAAAVFTLQPVLAVSGDLGEMVVGLAYPVLDVVILVLLAAGIAARGHRPSMSTMCLAAGILVFSGGDIVFLGQVAEERYVPGTLLDITWLVGVMFLATATLVDRSEQPSTGPARNLQLLPIAGAVVALAVPASHIFVAVPPVATTLAVVTIAIVLARLVISLREVSRLLSLSREARTDELTALPNRRGFFESLDELLATRPDVAVLLFDLDGFKDVNDTLGHAAGDELLRALSTKIRNRLPPQAIVARLGGDEFAVVLPTNDEGSAMQIAQEMTAWFVEPVDVAGQTVAVGVSCGVALAPRHGDHRSELLRCADIAMYRSKRNGDQRVVILDPSEAGDLTGAGIALSPRSDHRRTRPPMLTAHPTGPMFPLPRPTDTPG